jgi:hypothetical protein
MILYTFWAITFIYYKEMQFKVETHDVYFMRILQVSYQKYIEYFSWIIQGLLSVLLNNGEVHNLYSNKYN